MRKIATTLAATAAAVALTLSASPAQAVEFPPNWDCKNAGGTTYNCRASFTVKLSPKHNKYLPAVAAAKSRVINMSRARGVPFVEIPVAGCRNTKTVYWRCNLQWTMSLPDEVPAP